MTSLLQLPHHAQICCSDISLLAVVVDAFVTSSTTLSPRCLTCRYELCYGKKAIVDHFSMARLAAWLYTADSTLRTSIFGQIFSLFLRLPQSRLSEMFILGSGRSRLRRSILLSYWRGGKKRSSLGVVSVSGANINQGTASWNYVASCGLRRAGLQLFMGEWKGSCASGKAWLGVMILLSWNIELYDWFRSLWKLFHDSDEKSRKTLKWKNFQHESFSENKIVEHLPTKLTKFSFTLFILRH